METGWVLAGLNYLLTAFVLGSRADTALGFIRLVVIPAGLVLPWVAHPILGMISLASLGLVITESIMTDE